MADNLEVKTDVETEAEVLETGGEGSAGQAIVPQTTGGTDIVAVAERIDELVAAHNKIRSALLKLALPGDWVIFEGEKPTAELTGAGALRIASTVGISFTNWEARKVGGKDEKGDWYRWEFECDCVFRGNTVRALGRAGSRDKFFGKSHGELKALSDISEGDIKMAARRAAMKEGVKILLGLHHIPPEVLKQIGVPLVSARNIAFQKTPPQAEQVEKEEKMRQEIVEWAKEIDMKNYLSIIALYSTFTKTDPQNPQNPPKEYSTQDVKRLTGKWLNYTHHRIKEAITQRRQALGQTEKEEK